MMPGRWLCPATPCGTGWSSRRTPPWRAPRRSRIDSSHCLSEIFDEVVRLLDADGETQQVLRRGRAGALDRSPVLDQTFDASEAGRAREQTSAPRSADGRSGTAGDAHGQNRSESAAHLGCCDLVVRMIRQAGVVDVLDTRVSA